MMLGPGWVVITARGNVTAKPLGYTQALKVLENWRSARLNPRMVEATGDVLMHLHQEYNRMREALR